MGRTGKRKESFVFLGGDEKNQHEKVVSIIVALVIGLSAFLWYNDKHEPTVVEFTRQNVWEYVAIDYI